MGLLDLYRHLPTDLVFAEDYTEKAKALDKTGNLVDEDVVRLWSKHPLLIERRILEYVVNRFGLKIYMEYISGQSSSSGARVIGTVNDPEVIMFMDEIFDSAIQNMYFTAFAAYYAADKKDLCRTYFQYLIHKVLREDQLLDPAYRFFNIIREADMDTLAIQQASDLYWNTWTFTVGHELYHMQHMEEANSLEDEYHADEFGFKVLIQMIEDQQKGRLPKELDCFYEEFYLAPCAQMYLFEVLADKQLSGEIRKDTTHPSPKERFGRIVNLFDTVVPNDMDTTKGNAMLNTFMDVVDELARI